jgi:uncharacterized protein YcbX
MTTGSLAAIHIHPVKSCRRIELDEIVVSACGLAGDREWQIVDAGGGAVTQRQHKVLATIVPEPVPGGLRLSAQGHGTVEVARPAGDDRSATALLGDEVAVGDAGDEAARWLTGVIGADCRLVALTDLGRRHIRLVKTQPVTFVDAAPVLVANTASLADLQRRASEPFGMERFRPNLVVDTGEPWAEDTWQAFSIGGADLEAILPWPRCAVPQIDQDSAERAKEPALVLRAHRWCTEAPSLSRGLRAVVEGNGLFGLAATIVPAGTVLRVGDPLAVHRTAEPLLAPPAPLGS